MRVSIVFIALSLFVASCTKKESTAGDSGAAGSDATGASPLAAADAQDAGIEADGATPSDAGVEEETLEPLPVELQGDTPDPSAPPTVSVEDAGKEPRRALRYEIEPGAAQTAKIDVGFTIDAVVAIFTLKSPPHVISFDVALTPKKASEDELTVGVEVKNARFDEASVAKKRRKEQIQHAAEVVGKASGSFVVDARGWVRQAELQLPKGGDETLKKVPGSRQTAYDMLDNLRAALIQLPAVFPEEPVGAGAVWKVKRGIEQGGALVAQLTTYELVSLEESKAKLSVSIRQGGVPHPYKAPGNPVDLEVLLLNGTGSGEVSWSASSLMPTAGSVDIETTKGVRRPPSEPGARPVDTALQVERSFSLPSN